MLGAKNWSDKDSIILVGETLKLQNDTTAHGVQKTMKRSYMWPAIVKACCKHKSFSRKIDLDTLDKEEYKKHWTSFERKFKV